MKHGGVVVHRMGHLTRNVVPTLRDISQNGFPIENNGAATVRCGSGMKFATGLAGEVAMARAKTKTISRRPAW
jgi:hypothetical protein